MQQIIYIESNNLYLIIYLQELWSGLGLWYLATVSAIFQLYHGGQFY